MKDSVDAAVLGKSAGDYDKVRHRWYVPADLELSNTEAGFIL
jgi:hypothetical protein